jgi:hypothetical protein
MQRHHRLVVIFTAYIDEHAEKSVVVKGNCHFFVGWLTQPLAIRTVDTVYASQLSIH